MPQHPNRSLAASFQSEEERVSLCELLDRVLNKGVVVRGDIVISVADIDLLYLGVQLVLSSTETARQAGLLLPHEMTRTTENIRRAQELDRAARKPEATLEAKPEVLSGPARGSPDS